MKRFKILYLTQFPQIGGGETILLSLLEKLDRNRFEPIVILPQKGSLSQKLQSLKITTYYLPLNPYLVRTLFVPGASLPDLWSLVTLIKKIKPDLIHLNHLTFAIYAGLAAKLLKTPVIATAHGPWDSYYFYQDLASQFFVDKILANTPQTAQSLLKRKIINRNKIEAVPFGIDTNRFSLASNKQLATRKTLGLSPKDLVITVVGRLDPTKDHLTFLKAADIIQEQLPTARFLIVGSKLGDFSGRTNDYFQSIQKYLKHHRYLSKKVIFAGFIDPITPVYQATDILVSTSLSESFGLTLAEGAACGLPIVSTDSYGQRQIVKNGKNGFLVPPKSPDLLAAKILQLAKNPKLREELGKYGRNHIVKNFPIEKYISKVENAYLKLL